MVTCQRMDGAMHDSFEARIIMPWPKKALWQNARVHWAQRAHAVKSYRDVAYRLALHANLHKHPDPAPMLMFSFHPPDNRRRDLHNMMATQKASIDGIADAMRVDDRLFLCNWPMTWGKVIKGGAVYITVRVKA